VKFNAIKASRKMNQITKEKQCPYMYAGSSKHDDSSFSEEIQEFDHALFASGLGLNCPVNFAKQ